MRESAVISLLISFISTLVESRVIFRVSIARLHEVFGPGVAGSRLDALPATEFIDCHFPAKPLQHDTNLLLRGVFPPGLYPDLLHEAPGLPGSGLGSISFIFDFPGHNSLLSLFSSLLPLRNSCHLTGVYGFSDLFRVPLSLTVYNSVILSESIYFDIINLTII